MEIEGGHYSVFIGPGADEAGRAATEWFTEHLLQRKPAGTAPAR
jgi:hypothetical protein